MAFYEIVFIMRADLSPDAADKIAQNYGKIIKEEGAKVGHQENWGLLTLEYPIKKNKRGHFFLMQIEGEHKAVAELERRMSLDEDNLRFLTTRIKKILDEPSVFLRHLKEREEAALRDRDNARDRGDRDRGRDRVRDRDRDRDRDREHVKELSS